MPDEKPKFNPNKPYEIGSDSAIAEKPKFNPSKPYKEVEVADVLNEPDQDTFNQIINNLPDMDEGRKKVIKDITLRGTRGNDLRDAILIMQGKHPKQEGNPNRFYYDDKGIPRALGNGEKPPAGHDIANKWGTQAEANDDNKLTTLGKHIFNIMPSLVENVGDMVHLGYVLGQDIQNAPSDIKYTMAVEAVSNNKSLTDSERQKKLTALTDENVKNRKVVKEADWYKNFKQQAKASQLLTADKTKEAIIDLDSINEFKDVFKPDNYHFTAENIVGTVGSLAKSVGEFVTGGELTKPLSAINKSAPLFTASYMTQVGDAIDAGKQAGLSTEDAYKLGSTIAIPLALIDIKMGVEGRIFKDATANSENKALIENITKGFVKNSEGKITEESLKEAFDVTLLSKTSLAKTWGKETLTDIAGESGQEALQAFTQKAGEQLYDLLDNDKKDKFGTNAFSAKSFADYIQNGIAGALGGAPTALSYKTIKSIATDNEQSKTAFGLTQPKKGESADDVTTRINAYKGNIVNEVAQGKLTQEQADNAIFRIDSYKDYNNKIQELNIDNTQKRELFDLTFRKQEIIGELVGEAKGKHIDDLNPIDQAKYRTKEKVASDLQKKIDEIVMKSQVQNEPIVTEKTAKEVFKEKAKEEKKIILPEAVQAAVDRAKKSVENEEVSKKEYPKEPRSYEEIPVTEFNSKKLHQRNIHEKTVEFLEKQPNKQAVGTLTQLPFEYDGQKNETFGIKLPDGKVVRLASSMKRKEGFRGHFRTEHLIPDEQLEGFPVALKVEEIPAIEEKSEPQKVIKAFNAVTGKFIGFTKATQTGKNNPFSPKQIEQLEHIGTITETPIQGAVAPPITPTGQLQKQKVSKGIVEVEHHEGILKVTKHIQKVLPKIKVAYDAKLKSAGKLSADGKTISINPYYAGLDTPIHEGGHVLIDAMGYNNPTIQSAIKQLRDTDLYKETAKRYPELKGEMLDKEVLAEAIGREGADMFDVEVKKNAFQKLLDKIYEWFKGKLGLDKNVAKTLAKQLIRGEFKDAEGTETGIEQFQKESFEQLQKDLDTIEGALENETDEDTINVLEATRDIILENIETLKQENEDFKKGIKRVEKVANAKSLEGFTLDELIEAYHDAKNYDGFADKEMLNNVRKKIGQYFNETGKERLREVDKKIDEHANQRDLTKIEVWLKTLGHISEDFPALQEFYKVFNQAVLNTQTERTSKKSELEKLGKAVIREQNKKMGVGERALNLFTSNSAKYFEFLDNGKGQFKSPAEAKGLSKAQNDLLVFMRELTKERQAQDENGDLIDREILKTDKGFRENWKDSGLTDAIVQYMGGSNEETEIQVGGKKTTYKEAQKAIIAEAKKGLSGKALAIPKLLQVAYKAKKAGAKTNYGSLNYNGQLTSKFDQPRAKDKGYSKDFYSAAMSYIDDITHVENMGKLVPLVDSIEQFYKYLGFEENKPVGNVLKFIEQWKSEQIYQRTGEFDPVVDKTLQFFRSLTSMTVMGFNYLAGGMNLAIGNYNSWRAEGLGKWIIGQSRFFGSKDRAGYGTINKKAIDVLNKYHVVSQDFDSNPKQFAGKLFDMLAFGATRFGEYQIQGSMFLGQLSPEEWANFEYDKNGEIRVKNKAKEKEFTKKMLQYKDRVSDVQGKYNEKDRRNFMRFEGGKAVAQFKVWIPDWFKERYGKEYIDANNVTHRGSWNLFTQQAVADLRKDWSKHNIAIAWKNKQVRQNLSGAMTIAVLLIATHTDDEDKKKRRQALSLDNALQNVLFVYSPNQAKYLLDSPMASWGTMSKFIDALDAMLHGDTKKATKVGKKLIPYNKALDLVSDKK